MDTNTPGQNPHNCNCDHCDMSGHHGCCGHGYHRFFVLRWVLGLLILGIVFAIGLKIGEFKGEINSGYYGSFGGYGQMRHMMPLYYNQGQPMMYQSWGSPTGAGSATMMVPPTATPTPTK